MSESELEYQRLPVEPYISPDVVAYLDDNYDKEDLWKDIADAYYKGEMSCAGADPIHQSKFMAANPTPLLCDVAPHLLELAHDKSRRRDTFLDRVLLQELRTFHKDPTYKWIPQYQRRGTCVGQDLKLCCDTLLGIDTSFHFRKFPGRAAVAGTYTGGRVEVAGRPGSWDGSWNSVTAEWCTRGGVLLLKDLGLPDDSRDADEQYAVRWTATREGIPREYEDHADNIVVQRAVKMTNFEDCAACIMSGGVVATASNLIPTGKKDKHGFSPVRRSGGHSVAARGVRFDIPGLRYDNSWSGNWGSSGGKYPDDQPAGSVWITADEATAICRQGDTYGLWGVNGLELLRPDQPDYFFGKVQGPLCNMAC